MEKSTLMMFGGIIFIYSQLAVKIYDFMSTTAEKDPKVFSKNEV